MAAIRPRLRPDRPPLGALARGPDQAAAQLRIPQAPLLLVQRHRPELLPHRQAVERQLGLEREHRGERAAVHLGEHAPARGGGLLEQGEVGAPDLGRLPPAEQTPGHGPSRLDGQIAQPDLIIAQTGITRRAVHALAGQLEDPRVHLAHDAHQPPDFVPGGEPARDGAPVGGLVARRA